MHPMRLRDLGEKEVIKSIIRPLFNPHNDLGLVGDDCAVLKPESMDEICISTDRVPADLISFKLGIIDYFGLGYYLAVLNISDIAASGALPWGLMLTLAFDEDFLLDNFISLLECVKKACDTYDCQVLGGDLSNSPEMIYLGHTREVMGSDHYVPIIRGRSSTARLGLFIHVTADIIDIGSHNQWTLQLHAVQPVKVYPNMLIGQVTFWTILGEISLYRGKYQGAMGPRESEIYKDF